MRQKENRRIRPIFKSYPTFCKTCMTGTFLPPVQIQGVYVSVVAVLELLQLYLFCVSLQSRIQCLIKKPSSSAWASNVVLVAKLDQTVRWCLDYRSLNALTLKDAYPIPRIDMAANNHFGGLNRNILRLWQDNLCTYQS
jgi:hypothetical protein